MDRNLWLRIAPFFLCIFSLMALFLSFGSTVVNAPELPELHNFTREFTGWQASILTLYSWLLVALPLLILLAKLLPQAAHVEPAVSLLLPGVHVVIQFLTYHQLRGVGVGIPGVALPEGAQIEPHIGVGFLLMLACQIAMIVFRMIELTARKPASHELATVEEAQ